MSIDPDNRELERSKDALWAWAKDNRDLFRDTSQPTVVEAYIAARQVPGEPVVRRDAEPGLGKVAGT